ncbi:GDSL-type esterase/lipase family protein [Prevotella sp. KH2C16]|uniref:GDSL-type esterase/lipase family protein n=1 Tax=Prevotella sp. KH2C16 TaxID=1855325 RepID=UPI0008E26287|nr:GDSL-type esterase/lipase family protein [Prevotella sp. KH2C16]SFG05791.1 Lysophospholipase L1 [Prevotella sp. KH2C16]
MKTTLKQLIILALLLSMPLCGSAQEETANTTNRYRRDNAQLGLPAKNEKRVVFLGNSITEGWAKKRPDFFKEHNYIGRGISGQTTYHFLLRIREDVINLRPKIMVLNYGTNDIAENSGKYDEELTFGNIQTLIELAKLHKIKVILTSCLPAKQFGWRKSITGSMDKIRHLNARVKEYAAKNRIPYVDYFTPMLSENGQEMNPDYTGDGVHPNEKGYEIMERLVVPIIEKYR